MADELRNHLSIDGRVETLAFRSPLSVQRDRAPQRDRGAHGQRLLGQLGALGDSFADLERARVELGLPERRGMSIAVEFRPRGVYDYANVEWKNQNIEILTVHAHEYHDVVVLHVPDGRLTAFVKRISDYIAFNNAKGTAPKNASLVNAIENIRRAAFSELWSDSAPPPEDVEPHWFQVWLRHTAGNADELIANFKAQAEKVGVEVAPGFVRFPGRLIVAALATCTALQKTVELLDMVAEIRFVHPSAEFYLSDLTPAEQAEWIDDLLERTTFVVRDENEPYICILDTGVNNGHPLLEPALDAADMHTYDPVWGQQDEHGHGSEMAGIALYGDLTAALNAQGDIEIPHRLESVKILPPTGGTSPKLWGAVTAESVSRVEVDNPDRNRLFAMMTTSVGHLEGNPSEWSATVDQLAFGRFALDVTSPDDEPDESPLIPRLFVLSAGNVAWTHWGEYPDINAQSPVENPGQSWNALTVGAATKLVTIDENKHRDLRAIAQWGHLSPSSTTSILWAGSPWPFKPDVVAEGGNGALERGAMVTVGPESLRLLTTSNSAVDELLVSSGDTSAAAAEVARICAHIQARYPEYWPETIRGLIVHGAEHTPAMCATLPDMPRQREKEELLRTFGYGMVVHGQSEFSTSHRPTLVVQRKCNPYRRSASGGIVLGEMQLHDLPWPADELERLGGAQVAMRVTLSYFVEPNPSSRGWQSKFRYQSYALRFAVKGSTEEEEQFKRRINRLERAPDEDADFSDPDATRWKYGARLRARGCLHSDTWTGTAQQLAAKAQIAVFPVGGWWKDWEQMQQWDTEARYSLIVSLRVSDDIEADIYTPIANVIEQDVVIDINVDGSDLM